MKMMFGRMMLSEVVGMIICAFVPYDVEFLFDLFLPKPVVPHIPGLRSFLIDIIMYEAIRSRVVGFYRCRRLGMIKSIQYVPYRNSQLSIYKYTCCFRFCGGGYDVLKGFTYYHYSTIERWSCCFRWMVREIEIPSNSTLCVGQYKVCCIRIEHEDHITSIIPYEYIRICCYVVKYLLTFFLGKGYWISLRGRSFINGRKESIIQGSSMV